MLQNATFLLLDAARMGSTLAEAQQRNAAHDSLYRGGSSERLSGVAPYVFSFAYQTAFANWYLKTGWSQSWGILIRSAYPIAAVHKHFRKFLLVQSETGQQLYFRFYDPRVLRIFLPTCSREQILEFFGGVVDYFIAEDKDPAFAIRYRHENGQLRTERISIADLIAALPEPEPLKVNGTEDELLPETIEALREQGKLEEVLAAMNASKPAEAQKSAPAPAADVNLHPSPKPAAGAETTAPKKSKWNMFD